MADRKVSIVTKLEKESFEINWKINDFTVLNEQNMNARQNILSSSLFESKDETKWRLKFISSKAYEPKTKNYKLKSILFLEVETFGTDLKEGEGCLTVASFILNGQNNSVIANGQKKTFQVAKLFPIAVFFRIEYGKNKELQEVDWLIKDSLTIKCIIEIYGKISVEQYTFVSSNDNLKEFSTNIESSLKNMNTFSDFKIKTIGRTFDVHKVILSVRSSVFRAMLMNTLENDMIEILDFDENTVELMLEWIYSGKINEQNWTGANVTQLLAASDKFGLDTLKEECALRLYPTLTTENAVEILLLANLHGVKSLKEKLIQFINGHREILITKEFKEQMKTGPSLLYELYTGVAN